MEVLIDMEGVAGIVTSFVLGLHSTGVVIIVDLGNHKVVNEATCLINSRLKHSFFGNIYLRSLVNRAK